MGKSHSKYETQQCYTTDIYAHTTFLSFQIYSQFSLHVMYAVFSVFNWLVKIKMWYQSAVFNFWMMTEKSTLI